MSLAHSTSHSIDPDSDSQHDAVTSNRGLAVASDDDIHDASHSIDTSPHRTDDVPDDDVSDASPRPTSVSIVWNTGLAPDDRSAPTASATRSSGHHTRSDTLDTDRIASRDADSSDVRVSSTLTHTGRLFTKKPTALSRPDIAPRPDTAVPTHTRSGQPDRRDSTTHHHAAIALNTLTPDDDDIDRSRDEPSTPTLARPRTTPADRLDGRARSLDKSSTSGADPMYSRHHPASAAIASALARDRCHAA
jgi:hypothetical protein